MPRTGLFWEWICLWCGRAGLQRLITCLHKPHQSAICWVKACRKDVDDVLLQVSWTLTTWEGYMALVADKPSA